MVVVVEVGVVEVVAVLEVVVVVVAVVLLHGSGGRVMVVLEAVMGGVVGVGVWGWVMSQ